MPRDEKGVVAIFRNHVNRNEAKSKEAGRPIFDDVEICELRFAGSKNVFVFPATSFSHWDVDETTGEQVRVTYAERFPRQWQQFRSKEQQTKAGTPLDYLPWLTEGKKAEFRALNIFTVEALSVIDGFELKNLGPGGREYKEKALEFLASSNDVARITRMEAEIEELRAKNQILEEDRKVVLNAREKIAAQYDNMSDDQLREHVKAITGIEPKGNLPRKTLIRMIEENKQAA